MPTVRVNMQGKTVCFETDSEDPTIEEVETYCFPIFNQKLENGTKVYIERLIELPKGEFIKP